MRSDHARFQLPRLAAMVLAAAGVLVSATLGQEAGIGGASLLTSQAFDRITLTDDTSLLVDPISPRPLPPYDPRKDHEPAEKPKTDNEKPPREGNVFIPGREPPAVKARLHPEEQINKIVVHRIDADGGDFEIRRKNIKSIEYFEDLLLEEGDRLARVGDFSRAFEHFLAVKARNPNWPGLETHVNGLLLREGTSALDANQAERGLRLLRDLHARDPNFPGLADQLARAFGGRIREAIRRSDFAEGRRVLRELKQFAPDHPAVEDLTRSFRSRAEVLIKQANGAEGGARLDLLTEAVRVWPKLEGAPEAYREAFAALPTLDVGVIDVPRPLSPWVRDPAGERVASLVYLPVLANTSEEATLGKLPNQLADGLDVSDLGRRFELVVRNGVSWHDQTRTVTAVDVARALTDRVNPQSPGYNARWATLLDQIEVRDESHLSIRLTRTPLTPQYWLLGLVGPAHAGRDGLVPGPDGRRLPVGDGPYRAEVASEASRLTLLAANGSSQASPPPIVRVRETAIADDEAMIHALLRGEVSMLAEIAPWRVAELADEPEIQVGAYQAVSLHRLAFDGRKPLLRNRSLRRGLSYAIDRKMILEESLLKRPIDQTNKPSDGVFAAQSYADAPDVEPLLPNSLLARMLVAAAQKELGIPSIQLTLQYPARPDTRAAVARIAQAWREAGVDVVLKERPESELEQAIRSGAEFEVVYRCSRSLEPVHDAGLLICPGYDAPPEQDGLASIASPRILQLLLQLEKAPDWPTARALAIEIDRESRDELPVLPLWQLQDHYAWRTRLEGPGPGAESLYQGIERWKIAPWFAEDGQ